MPSTMQLSPLGDCAMPPTMQLSPLGDSAWLVRLADEAQAVALAQRLRAAAPAWLVDVVPAYRSVGVFFDLLTTDDQTVARWISTVASQPHPPDAPGTDTAGRDCTGSDTGSDTGDRTANASVDRPLAGRPARRHLIPCCYALGPDLALVAELTGLTPEAVVALHAGQEYTVYAIGFAPGFAYLGYLPERLCGVPRLARPRLRVEPGSVGLTGRQTGVYPLPRPGGWPLIGRTPLLMVEVETGYFPLAVGDRVRFVPITEAEYDRWQGRRVGDWPSAAA